MFYNTSGPLAKLKKDFEFDNKMLLKLDDWGRGGRNHPLPQI